MDYLKAKQTLATVNEKDVLLSKSDKWEAHRNGILHRGFTVILKYQGQYYLQHRKHLVFDNTFDLTFSSHQLYFNDVLEDDKASIIRNLKREFVFDEEDLDLQYLDKVYYKEADKKSEFTEHEIDYVYLATLKKPLVPNLEYSYGVLLVTHEMLMDENGLIYKNLAPWAKKILLLI
jgi:isopentenyldiphosphate isomerase